MKNYIRVFCLLSACFGLSACSDDVSRSFSSFQQICEFSGGTYIGDKDDNIGKCKCGNNTECNPGVACINGKCADNTIVNVICEENTTKCIDGTTQICKNEKWEKDKDCDHKGCAVDALDCAECTGDEVICEERTLKVCSGGRWLKTSCQFGCASDNDSNHCIECLNDTIRCNENIRERCENGKWEEYKCPYERPYCSKGECLDVECKNNAETCRDGKMMICSADNTFKENPDNTCDSKVCFGEKCLLCNEKDTKCDNGMRSVCTNNTWGEAENCPGDYSCMNEKSCGECQDNQTKCEGNVQHTCTKGKWHETGKCSDAPNQCGDGESTCNGNLLKTCSGGEWVDTVCPNGCENGECIDAPNECDDSDVPKCIPNSDGSGQMKICTNGSWETKSCNGFSCNLNNDCGVCKNEDKECIDDNGIGQLKKCSDGSWTEDSCQNVSCNADKSGCGVCKNGDTQCTDNAEQKCENGDWITTTVCPLGCNWNKECKCRNDDYRCGDNNSLEKCEGGTWSPHISMKACTCKDNTNNVGVFSDNNNTFSKTYNCIHNFSCDGENKCGECTNGTKAYGNSSEFKCINGKWEGNMIEKPCNNDEESCIGWGTSTEFYKFKCVNNNWVNTDVCQEQGCQNC